MTQQITIPQALFLLSRHAETGKPKGNYNAYIQPAGALTELIVQKRIALRGAKKPIVHVIDTSPTGSAYIDSLLSDLTTSSRQRRMDHWVSKFSHKRDRVQTLGRELVAKGIVEEMPDKILGLFPVTRWPLRSTRVKTKLMSDMSRVLFGTGDIDDEFTYAVIALANAGHLLKRNFDRDALRANKARIKDVTSGNFPGSVAAKQAIDAANAAAAASTVVIAAAAATG